MLSPSTVTIKLPPCLFGINVIFLLDGIITENENISDKISVTTVKVLNENGSKLLGKDIGNYITINIENIEVITNEELKQVIDIFSRELIKLINFDGPILVVGLGNEDTTANEIGPKVIKDLEITRHVFRYKPELLPENTKNVCASHTYTHTHV